MLKIVSSKKWENILSELDWTEKELLSTQHNKALLQNDYNNLSFNYEKLKDEYRKLKEEFDSLAAQKNEETQWGTSMDGTISIGKEEVPVKKKKSKNKEKRGA